MNVETSRPPFVFRTATLASGLRVVLVPRRELHRVAVALYLRVGSRYEAKDDNGISHFLEHMLYRGTPSMPTSQHQALAFERLGGTLYAATATDHGMMTITLPPESLARAIPLLGEVAQRPRLSNIDVERRIVHEEILEDLDDEGRQIDADNIAREILYGEHPLGFPITGTPAHLDRFDEDALRRHHARHYGTKNAVLTVAGAFDEDVAMRAISASFGEMRPGERAVASPPPKLNGEARVRYVESDSSQTEVRVAFRAPGDHDRLEPATEILLRVVDDGMSTRLYRRICDEQGLCYDVSATFEPFEDDGVFDFASSTQHARSPDVVAEILRLCAELAEHGPTDEELDKVRARLAWSTRAMLDDADDLANFFGLAAVAGVTLSPSERLATLVAVNKDQVREAAQRVFRPEGLGVVAVGVLSRAEQRKLERVTRSFR